jgi:hypothetical protein
MHNICSCSLNDVFYPGTSFNAQATPCALPFSGLLTVLECLPYDASIDMYGFNWSEQNWGGHAMQLEASLINILHQQFPGVIRVWVTPCSHYRDCEKQGMEPAKEDWERRMRDKQGEGQVPLVDAGAEVVPQQQVPIAESAAIATS